MVDNCVYIIFMYLADGDVYINTYNRVKKNGMQFTDDNAGVGVLREAKGEQGEGVVAFEFLACILFCSAIFDYV